MRLKAITSIALSLLLLFSFTSFADSVSHAEHNSYFKCKHTHQKVERTKNCPCGCNKKKRNTARITSDNFDCDNDDVIAHAPAFEKLTADASTIQVPTPHYFYTTKTLSVGIFSNIVITPPVPPG
jgi:hypothetical protein